MSDFNCLIKPGNISGSSTYSKFLVQGWKDESDTEAPLPWSFSINADTSVTAFNSPGATDDPPQCELDGSYQNDSDRTGFDSFKGKIGGGKIYIETGKGVIIKGNIEGGPDKGQSFTGSGTWLQG